MKYLFLLLLAFPVMAKEPRFHYKDAVEVVHGFYKGCKGSVDGFEEPNQYYVSGDDCKGYSFSEKFSETDLKLVKASK